jgi:hypothetical protein
MPFPLTWLEVEGLTAMLKKLLVSIAALAMSTPAFAHDHSGGLFCRVTDDTGQRIAWSFVTSGRNADTGAGAMVETAFSGRSKFVEGQHGSRPVWISLSTQDGLTLLSRNDRSWALVISRPHNAEAPLTGGEATLYRNSNVIAVGECGDAQH